MKEWLLGNIAKAFWSHNFLNQFELVQNDVKLSMINTFVFVIRNTNYKNTYFALIMPLITITIS